MRRATATVLLVLALAATSACSSSDDDASATTTGERAASTTVATTTTEATTTEAPATTAASGEAAELPSCQELLVQYTETFTPDDLPAVAALFRSWAPNMPDEVAAAVTNLADAYDEAGTLADLDITDVDLSADAQVFSDWTNEGCPTS